MEHKPSEQASQLPGGSRSASPDTDKPGIWSRLVDYAITAIAVAGFAGLFYWGQRTGWQLNRGAAAAENDSEKNDWCEEHRVPESICIECHPEKVPPSPSYGWCEEHGVSNCLWEHPDLAETTVRPTIAAGELSRIRAGLGFTPRAENNKNCKLIEKRIQLASASVAKKCGFEEKTVESGLIEENLDVHGDLMYDQTRIARLSPRVSGSLWSVLKQMGDSVHKGDVLAPIEAADVGASKEFSQRWLRRNCAPRTGKLLRQGARPGPCPNAMCEADTAAQEVRIRLGSRPPGLLPI